jgi:hypothetical protein
MALVDERGRLFGRLNLLDAVLLILLLGLLPLGYAAYALFREQPPRIVSVSPQRTEQSVELRLNVKGENLRPYMRISAGTNQAVDFLFRSTTEVEAPFINLPPGEYDVVLFDHAQERFRLPKGLTVLPSALPATEIVAVGAFGNLDASGAKQITPGLELPGVGRVTAVGKPVPDLTKVFASPGLVGVPIANSLRVPAAVTFLCHVKAQQGRPNCVVGDTAVTPPNLIMMPTPLGKTPFQVEQVRSPHPMQAVPIKVRLTGDASLLSLVRSGDVDTGPTSNELAALARVTGVVPAGRPNELGVNLLAQLQLVDGQWLYDSAPLRVGAPITLRTSRYQIGGVVTDMPAPSGNTP